PNTSAKAAHIALTYFYLSDATCSLQTCDLNAGFISSADSGVTWSTPVQLAGPMKLSWLPTKSKQPMFADYISTSWVNGKAFGVFPVAQHKVGTSYNMAIFTNQDGFLAGGNERISSNLEQTPSQYWLADSTGETSWFDFLDTNPHDLAAPKSREILEA